MTLGHPWAQGPPPPAPTSGMAVAALVLGVLGVTVLPIGAALVAAPVGVAGLVATREGRRGGRGMALAGLLLGLTTGVLPAVALLALWDDLHRGWAGAVALYGVGCLVAGLVALASGGPGGRRLLGVAVGAGVAGTIAVAVGIAVIVALAVAVAYGAIWLVQEIARQTTSSLWGGGRPIAASWFLRAEGSGGDGSAAGR